MTALYEKSKAKYVATSAAAPSLGGASRASGRGGGTVRSIEEKSSDALGSEVGVGVADGVGAALAVGALVAVAVADADGGAGVSPVQAASTATMSQDSSRELDADGEVTGKNAGFAAKTFEIDVTWYDGSWLVASVVPT